MVMEEELTGEKEKEEGETVEETGVDEETVLEETRKG